MMNFYLGRVVVCLNLHFKHLDVVHILKASSDILAKTLKRGVCHEADAICDMIVCTHSLL
jgi:hypothetical protein